MTSTVSSSRPGKPAARKRSLVPMVLVFLVSLAPIVGAIVVYLNPQWWPDGERSHGSLIDPQRPVPSAQALPLTTLDGQPFDLASLKGRWVMITAYGGACDDACARNLFITRNVHASQGKNVDRAARVWLITDAEPVPEKVLQAYQGTIMLRADPQAAAAFLARPGEPASALHGPIWVMDPLGNLMLRFPDQADPVKVRDDVRKLLRQSRIG